MPTVLKGKRNCNFSRVSGVKRNRVGGEVNIGNYIVLPPSPSRGYLKYCSHPWFFVHAIFSSFSRPSHICSSAVIYLYITEFLKVINFDQNYDCVRMKYVTFLNRKKNNFRQIYIWSFPFTRPHVPKLSGKHQI